MVKLILQLTLLTLICIFSRNILQALNLWNAFPLFAGFALLHYYNLNRGAYALGTAILFSSIAFMLLKGGNIYFAVLQLSLITLFMAFPRSKSISVGLLTLVSASFTYYLTANTISWLTMPEYAMSFAGWIQSQTTGLPGYPASILFLRNQIFAELITFTVGLSLPLLLQNKQPAHI